MSGNSKGWLFKGKLMQELGVTPAQGGPLPTQGGVSQHTNTAGKVLATGSMDSPRRDKR